MKIPTREQIIENQRKARYLHFAYRLQERYRLRLTYEEWLLLCTAPFESIHKKKKSNKTGWVIIQETKVLCVKKWENGPVLVTALPVETASKYLSCIQK